MSAALYPRSPCRTRAIICFTCELTGSGLDGRGHCGRTNYSCSKYYLPVEINLRTGEEVEHIALPRDRHTLAVNTCIARPLLVETVISSTAQLRAPPLLKEVYVLETHYVGTA